jgi:hypothetical protein
VPRQDRIQGERDRLRQTYLPPVGVTAQKEIEASVSCLPITIPAARLSRLAGTDAAPTAELAQAANVARGSDEPERCNRHAGRSRAALFDADIDNRYRCQARVGGLFFRFGHSGNENSPLGALGG